MELRSRRIAVDGRPLTRSASRNTPKTPYANPACKQPSFEHHPILTPISEASIELDEPLASWRPPRRSEQQCSKRIGIVQGPWHNHSCWLDSALVGLLSVATGLKEWLMHMDCLFITNPSMCAKLETEETFALQGWTLALEIWSLIREYTQLAYDYDSKPVKDASDAYFKLRERIISLVIILSKERKSYYTTPLKRGQYSNPSSWLVSLYTFTVDHIPIPIPRDHLPTSSARAQIETHFQRAGYSSACQCVQIEILPRRHFIVDWPVLLSSLNLSEPTLSEVFGSLVGQPTMADIVSITSLPRVLVFNINNQYPRHEQPPRELRLAVSGQMELVWSIRSEVRHILSGEHFATDAIVGYGEEAARYHFDAMRERESYDFLPSFNALLDQQWHELWGLYYDSEALTDLPSKVSTMPLDGSFDEGKGVWKMQDASVLFEGFKSVSQRTFDVAMLKTTKRDRSVSTLQRCDLLGQLCSSGRSC
ncbi:BQ5605_C034g11336 [Microbotryum silenes-dioicae]|uniref:BQ5605_C034g11336 protein n=1 Tax=Microbotryum silenes-dioicae TaxID=796604 RepID=A0A2X0PHS6_9BASI|nr:BQ5605_C034g11336 [Microbotryum silenes-dioicae]